VQLCFEWHGIQAAEGKPMGAIYYTVKVLAALWLCMILIIFALGGNKSSKDDRFSMLLLIATLSSVLQIIDYGVSLGVTGLGAITWGFPILSYLGFFLIFLGVAIHWIGILTLKRQFATMVVVSEGHKLVDTGIYKFIRHPIYTAILLELLGFGLALANWVSILLLLIPNAASLAYRIYVEEKVLVKYFGEAYIDYERKTKRLIPGIF
jgi:protein-S-isoprenylcysteine O-methyltransferase Ste14